MCTDHPHEVSAAPALDDVGGLRRRTFLGSAAGSLLLAGLLLAAAGVIHARFADDLAQARARAAAGSTLIDTRCGPIEVQQAGQGRPLLVPITAFNILYRWGSNSNGQTSASHLVGKETGGEKLAPFRLDVGPRVFRRLAAREHQLRVRN